MSKMSKMKKAPKALKGKLKQSNTVADKAGMGNESAFGGPMRSKGKMKSREKRLANVPM
jgi:hypothetical protein